jgi:hypothetical protein
VLATSASSRQAHSDLRPTHKQSLRQTHTHTHTHTHTLMNTHTHTTMNTRTHTWGDMYAGVPTNVCSRPMRALLGARCVSQCLAQPKSHSFTLFVCGFVWLLFWGGGEVRVERCVSNDGSRERARKHERADTQRASSNMRGTGGCGTGRAGAEEQGPPVRCSSTIHLHAW